MQLSLFASNGEILCSQCNKYIAEYDTFCDSCASDYMYAWCLCCDKHGFKDYSEAVKKIGREKIDKIFEDEGWFQKVLNQHQKI